MATPTSYAQLQTDLLDTVNRTDLAADVTAFTPGPLEGAVKRAITKAEIRLRRDLRVQDAETSTAFSLASATTTMPSDTASVRLMYVNADPISVLEPSSLEQLYEAFPFAAGGKPQRYAISGDTVYFRPVPDGTYSMVLHYHKKPSLLSDSNTSNLWLTDYYDLLFYACLLELTAHVQEDERIALWKGFYDEGVRMVNRDDTIARWSGSVIKARVSANVVV